MMFEIVFKDVKGVIFKQEASGHPLYAQDGTLLGTQWDITATAYVPNPDAPDVKLNEEFNVVMDTHDPCGEVATQDVPLATEETTNPEERKINFREWL